MALGMGRLVKCSLTDGSILKDYTSMLFNPNRPTGIPVEVWDMMGPKSPVGNEIFDTATSSDLKWLYVACRGWWAMFDLENDKCVSRQICTPK